MCDAGTMMGTLTNDALGLVFDEAAKDTVGNHVVPGLAQLAAARVLCKGIRDAAAAITTVYDADIEYEAYGRTTVPVRFRGGLWFGRSKVFDERDWERFAPALAVIREKRTSRMFVVTVRNMRDKWCSIGRIYVVAQLAQLLGGHTSDWSRRLPNLHEVAYSYKEVDRSLSMRYHSTTPVDLDDLGIEHQSVGIVRKNQLTSKTWHGVDGGGFTKHRDDFISHALQHGVTNAGRTMWRRHPSGNFTITVVRCQHDAGSTEGYMCTRTLATEECTVGTPWEYHKFRPGAALADEGAMPSEYKVQPLSRAFGWYSIARQAEGPGWLVSLLADAGRCPTLLPDCIDCPVEDLMEMGADAKEARANAEWLRTQPYHPTKNPTGYRKTKKRGLRERGHRAAKAVAMDRMRQRSESDVEFDESDVSEDAPYVQPKRPKRAPSPVPAPAPAPTPEPAPRTMFEIAMTLRTMISKYETPEDRVRQLSRQMTFRGVNACGRDN